MNNIEKYISKSIKDDLKKVNLESWVNKDLKWIQNHAYKDIKDKDVARRVASNVRILISRGYDNLY